MKVLVADDSPAIRLGMRKWLNQKGFDVVDAGSGNEAWEILNLAGPPRIAVLDWMMPGVSGVEICSRLKLQVNRPLTYIIIATSKCNDEDIAVATASGAHCFLPKPCSPGQFHSAVAVGRRMVEYDDRLREYESRESRSSDSGPMTAGSERRQFLELAEKELCRARRYERPMSLLIVRVKNLSQVKSDTGDRVADEVISAMKLTCQGALRKSDLLGRLNEKELAIVLPEASADAVSGVAERMRRVLEATAVIVGREPVRLQVGIRVATAEKRDMDVEALFRRAASIGEQGTG